MANLGISNTHVDRFGGSKAGKRAEASTRHRLTTAFHFALFGAAFVFVAAVVCGALG